MARFFTAAALALALGTASASSVARPEHHGHARHQRHAKSGKAKGKKAKDEDAAAGQAGNAEHDVKEPGRVKGSSSKGSKDEPTARAPEVVETEKTGTGKKAIKTYKFGPQEVEGRLRSPQIIYFLRRVRAEFEAGDLGHRSFMRELSDTRRDPAFR